jgi:hypothetical protein
MARKDDIAGLIFAPMVIWARMPIIMYEAMNPDPSRRDETNRMVVEKIAATQEGVVAAQMAMAEAAVAGSLAVMRGHSPAVAATRAAERVMRASLAPAARRVRANAKRLSG